MLAKLEERVKKLVEERTNLSERYSQLETNKQQLIETQSQIAKVFDKIQGGIEILNNLIAEENLKPKEEGGELVDEVKEKRESRDNEKTDAENG